MHESIQVRSRSFFSIVHIQAASLFAREAHKIELAFDGTFDDEQSGRHRSYVTAGIISATAFVEATINEIFSESEEPKGGELQHLGADVVQRFRELWIRGVPRTARYSILEKYEIALVLADLPGYDRGRRPYQDVKLLTQLRNDLVHFEPEWVEHATEENEEGLSKLAQGLRGRFAINPLTGGGNPFYPAKCLGHGCVQWAVQSSIQFTDEFYNRMEMKIRYEHVRDRLGTEVDHE